MANPKCNDTFCGDGAPGTFTFSGGGDFPAPDIGFQFKDKATGREYAWDGNQWRPLSWIVFGGGLQGDLEVVQQNLFNNQFSDRTCISYSLVGTTTDPVGYELDCGIP